MATEDTDIEAGGQTDDAGETADADEEPAEGGGERQAARGEEGDRPNHKERKRNRFKEEREGRERAERALGELQGRYQGLESQFNELRQEITRDKQAAQQSSASDGKKARINDLREQAETHLIAAATSKDPAYAKAEKKKYQDLMDEADDLRDELRWEKRQGGLREEFSSQIPNPEVSREVNYLEGKYPQVAENLEAQALTAARFNTLVQKGMPRNRATMEAAITYAMAKLGIGGRSAPSDASRRAYVGTGQRDGESDGGGSVEGAITPEDVRNNLALKNMAEKVFKDDEAPQAYAKFAKMYNADAKRNGVSG